VYPFADPSGAAAEVRAEGLITATGLTYRQEYVLILRAEGGKIAHLREYFDPVRASRAPDTPLADGHYAYVV
jgi:ketosteroid isomerase-like protein